MTRREFFKGMLGLPLLAIATPVLSQAQTSEAKKTIINNGLFDHCDIRVDGPLILDHGSTMTQCRVTIHHAKVGIEVHENASISGCTFDMIPGFHDE
jgi:hypothetical protein